MSQVLIPKVTRGDWLVISLSRLFVRSAELLSVITRVENSWVVISPAQLAMLMGLASR